MSGNYIGNNPNGTDYILSDDYRTNNTKLFASTACVNNAVNEIKGTAFLPLGHFFLHPFPTPPDGCLVVNGSEYNRELYKDLFADAVRKNYVKSESEWQSIAAANNGYCPWYSDGDGSTTFRVPKFAPYQKLALVSGDAGKYYEAGLPNIEGRTGATSDTNLHLSGCCYAAAAGNRVGVYNTASTSNKALAINASLSNSIYGNSTTVTPESHDWIVCVVAYGKATNIGEADVSNVMSAVGQVQSDVSGKLDNTIVHLVETWKSEDGTSWYRKYSDGWIEQGGKINVTTTATTLVNFLIPFVTSVIYVSCNTIRTSGASENGADYVKDVNLTFCYFIHESGLGAYWYACGY